MFGYFNKNTVVTTDENTSVTTLTKGLYTDYTLLLPVFIFGPFVSLFSLFVAITVTQNTLFGAILSVSMFVAIYVIGIFIVTTQELHHELEYYTNSIPKKNGVNINILSYGTYDLGTASMGSYAQRRNRIQGQKHFLEGNEVSVNTKLVITPFKQYIVETHTLLVPGLWDDAFESAVSAYDFTKR